MEALTSAQKAAIIISSIGTENASEVCHFGFNATYVSFS